MSTGINPAAERVQSGVVFSECQGIWPNDSRRKESCDSILPVFSTFWPDIPYEPSSGIKTSVSVVDSLVDRYNKGV